jgi:hypothetical protein
MYHLVAAAAAVAAVSLKAALALPASFRTL